MGFCVWLENKKKPQPALNPYPPSKLKKWVTIVAFAIFADISRRNAHAGDYRNVSYRTERGCHVVEDYREEERLTGYNVTYRYAGVDYTTHMDRHPGDSIRVRVKVRPESSFAGRG